MLAGILSAITYVWHRGQHLKLRYVRDNRVLLQDLFELDPDQTSKREKGAHPANPRKLRNVV
jgi:hypothetical protein